MLLRFNCWCHCRVQCVFYLYSSVGLVPLVCIQPHRLKEILTCMDLFHDGEIYLLTLGYVPVDSVYLASSLQEISRLVNLFYLIVIPPHAYIHLL